ncbi:MAG: DUF3078 domain-containing protein, partial [Bacteroidales bacterium]|nr:DUF3078 domain-containing protein [Bacteroidales bacterium]
MDSLKKAGYIFSDSKEHPVIALSREQAVEYLQKMNRFRYWKDVNDPFRKAIGQLVWEATNQPFDSAAAYLRAYPYDSLSISWDQHYIWEPLRFKVPVIRKEQAAYIPVTDSVSSAVAAIPDSTSQIRGAYKVVLADTSMLVVIDTLDRVSSQRPGFPFRYYEYPYQADSISVAVGTLLRYLETRDSSLIYFTGSGKTITPVWINAGYDKAIRYWLQNDLNDSVTIWIDNHDKNTIGLYLEHGVNFRRPSRQAANVDARINVESIDKSTLLEIDRIMVKPQYWKLRSEASFVLNQTALYNWVKGGEKSISLLTDIIGFAEYNNKALKISSANYGRIKIGFLKSGENPVRKNVDLIELSSKVNHKAFGKFDFSAIMLYKNQLAPGYNYSTDPPDMVSKFMNPSILTLGVGLDYKPSKETSINFSPFSFKSTFVTDTVNIDQTKYGVGADRRSRNELGANLILSNQYKPFKNLMFTNRLHLFSNYINNPLNIDVDWEMIAVWNLNWFTDVRLNTHLIYDDDTKTKVLDDDNNPVIGPDGKPKQTARPQFKEMLGF